jgi:NAD(P)-dependent dehydrogenase (short-subunit alcohol dehydrogenase family)
MCKYIDCHDELALLCKLVIYLCQVTGSNQGIGLAIVRALCKEFDGVTYLTARNTEAGHKAVEELKKENCNAHFHQLDINDKKSVGELKSYLQSKYGGIDILVNNAGILFKVLCYVLVLVCYDDKAVALCIVFCI